MITSFLRPNVKALLKLLFKVRVTGNSAQLKHKKVIIIANHVSFLDEILIGFFLPIKPLFAVYAGYYDHWIVRIARYFMEFVPIDPANPMVIKQLVREVEKGRTLVIFPEGRVTLTGSLMKIYDGAAFIAAKANATIVPVWIEGAEFSLLGRLKGLFKRRLFPRITLHLLSSEQISMPPGGKASNRRYLAGEKLHKIMMHARMASRPKITLFEAFLDSQSRYGGMSPVINDITFKENSYRALLKKGLVVERIAQKMSIKGERIGILLPNITLTAATLLGLSAAGRIPAMLNYTAGTKGIETAIQVTQLITIITSRRFLDQRNLAHFVTDFSQIKWYFVEDFTSMLIWKDKFNVISRTFIPRLIKPVQRASDAALILFTSGSEGNAKAVVHSHNSLLANVEQIRTILDPTPSDKFMSTLPLFHAFGLTAGLLLPVLSGSRVFLYPNPLHYRAIPEVVYDQSCTILFATPTFLSQYGKFAHPFDFMRLRYVVTGAERLPESTRQLWMDKFGIRILEGYGVTECAPVIALNVPVAFKKGTVGRLLPSIEARLIPVKGINSGGRLQICGPNVMKGYLGTKTAGILEKNDPDQAKMTRWYDTGDIVSIDSDGFLTIEGRIKRFAKIGAEMISLELIESIAQQADANAMHGAAVQFNQHEQEELVLFTTSKTLTRSLFVAAAKQLKVPMLTIPHEIRSVENLPLLGSGKVDVVALTHQLIKEAES